MIFYWVIDYWILFLAIVEGMSRLDISWFWFEGLSATIGIDGADISVSIGVGMGIGISIFWIFGFGCQVMIIDFIYCL